MKLRLIYLMVGAAALFAGISTLLDAQADDTYNFYFQKAPGPTTVNQGGAPAAAKTTDVVVNPDAPKVNGAPAPAAANQTAAQAEVASPSSRRSWELSAGYSQMAIGERGHGLASGQWTLGLQFNLNKYFALQAEGFYLSSGTNGQEADGAPSQVGGKRFDYAGTLVITPFSLPVSESMSLKVSALGGYITVPEVGYVKVGSEILDPRLREYGHPGCGFYGARLALGGDRLNGQLSAKWLDAFTAKQITASLAYAF